jgi:hypothetical protein
MTSERVRGLSWNPKMGRRLRIQLSTKFVSRPEYKYITAGCPAPNHLLVGLLICSMYRTLFGCTGASPQSFHSFLLSFHPTLSITFRF